MSCRGGYLSIRAPPADRFGGHRCGAFPRLETSLMRYRCIASLLTLLIPLAAHAQQPTKPDTSAARPGHAATLLPRISQDSARAVAVAGVPHGIVKSAELEHEHSTLVYSYDIAVPGHDGIEEVQVSALNGRVVSRTHESSTAEAAERRQEAREKHSHHPSSTPPKSDDSTGTQ